MSDIHSFINYSETKVKSNTAQFLSKVLKSILNYLNFSKQSIDLNKNNLHYVRKQSFVEIWPEGLGNAFIIWLRKFVLSNKVQFDTLISDWQNI